MSILADSLILSLLLFSKAIDDTAPLCNNRSATQQLVSEALGRPLLRPYFQKVYKTHRMPRHLGIGSPWHGDRAHTQVQILGKQGLKRGWSQALGTTLWRQSHMERPERELEKLGERMASDQRISGPFLGERLGIETDQDSPATKAHEQRVTGRTPLCADSPQQLGQLKRLCPLPGPE